MPEVPEKPLPVPVKRLEEAVDELVVQTDLIRALTRQRGWMAAAEVAMIAVLIAITVIALVDGISPWAPVSAVTGFVMLARAAMHAEIEGELRAARERSARRMREVERRLLEVGSLAEP